jgi:hypothetical protein
MADGRRTHGDRKEEHTEEHSDGHTRTSGSNTHMEQHGTPLDGSSGGWCVCVSCPFRERYMSLLPTNER